MKNVKESMLKKCIFMVFGEFEDLIYKLTDGLKYVEYESGGIYFDDTNKATASDTYWNEDILDTLSKYFDTTITSVHTDDCDVIGVWICYKD